MADTIEARINAAGIVIPDLAMPAANYVPYVVSGNMVYVSGQVPFVDGRIDHTGKVGQDLTTDIAAQVARICALNILAAVKHACRGDLERVQQVVKLGGFVNCVDGFSEQPQVINGASDLMVEVFGEKGQHARFAVGTNALPLNVPVEVDGLFEIK